MRAPGRFGAKRLLILLLAIAIVTTTGCRIKGLQFREDNKVQILAPQDRAEIKLPIVMRWKGEGERFGVFIDVVPQPPGEGLDYFFRKDPSCRPATSCVAPEFLAGVGVFETSEPTFTISNIGRREGVPKDQQDWHEITVALLDDAGRRVGESGDWVLLKLMRQES